MTKTETGGESPPALWDRVVRISHWGIAAAVFANELLTRGGSAAHIWIGWIGLGLLGLRLIWGIFGAREARFSAFPPDPAAAIRHTRDLLAGKPRHYGSHNPAGAVMAYALWAAIAVTIATGFVMSGPSPFAIARQEAAVNSNDWSSLVAQDGVSGGGEAGLEEDDHGNWAKALHGAMANLILVLVSLHVAGVVVEGLVMRRNLVLPMVFGDHGSRKS